MSEIELVVIKQRSKDNATGAATVLEKMAHKFLPCSVRYIGAVTLAEDMDAPITVSSTLLPRPRSDVDMTAVKEITRHLIVSAGLQKKREAYVEKRL